MDTSVGGGGNGEMGQEMGGWANGWKGEWVNGTKGELGRWKEDWWVEGKVSDRQTENGWDGL